MKTLASHIRISPNILFKELPGEALLLNQTTGVYFALDEMGLHMWKLLVQYGQLEAVYQAILAEYEVDPQQLEKDLLNLTDELAANELLEIDPA